MGDARDLQDRNKSYLHSSGIPTLSAEDGMFLNELITVDELRDTVKSLLNCRTPGPDSYSYLYYKTYIDSLVPHMVSLFNSFLGGHPIPSKIVHSYISVLPKKGKDPYNPSSYRPIALLNTDLKIFIRNRLNMVLPDVVSKDEWGFIKFR